MPNVFTFVLTVLAAFRIGELLGIDTISQQLRAIVGRRAAGKKEYTLEWYAAEWINCPYCIGVWAAFVLAFFLKPTKKKQFVLYWFGIAGAQAVLQSLVGRTKE